MESKAHFKKCVEKGINPHTPIEDGTNVEEDHSPTTATSHNVSQAHTEDCDTVSDDYSDGDELEIDVESSGKSFFLSNTFSIFFWQNVNIFDMFRSLLKMRFRRFGYCCSMDQTELSLFFEFTSISRNPSHFRSYLKNFFSIRR